MRRPLVLPALILSLSLAACHPPARRPAGAGDELPYPPLEAAAMDRTASPCQDFYQYACGRWIAETAAPPDRPRWVRGAGELEERNTRLLRRILEDARAGKVEAQERFGRKAGDFYSACMEEADVEAHAPAELQAEWARLDAVDGREELGQELSRLEAMGIPAPLAVEAVADPADPRRGLLALAPAGPGPSEPPPGRPDEPGAEAARAAYAEHVRAQLRLAGVPAARVEGEAEAAIALERALAAARTVGPDGVPARLDRAALEKLAPGAPWSALLLALGAGPRAALAAPDPAFLAAFGRLFQEAPLPQWRAYLRWRLTDALTAARATTAAMAEEQFRFEETLAPAGPAAAELRPRWKHCVDLTGRTFAFVAGSAFGRRHLGAAGRDRAADLVSDVEAGMRAAVEGAGWMDAATQVRAGRKLERLQVLVGYPDAGPVYDRLRVGRESFFRNVLSAGRFAVAGEVARAERGIDRAEWVVGPFAPAPAYLADRNTLYVPAGALQPPLYLADAPEAVRLGAMGTQVGRAMAEVVQGEGRTRGAEGERVAWWTPEAGRRFAAAEACLAEQYQAYRPAAPGAAMAGAPPPDEVAVALGEMAGLRAAHEAWRAAQARGAAAPRLLGFTPDQQFFLAYAQTLCTARPAGAAGDDLPARFRVNGPLSDFPEFARAFRCGEGTPMARPAAARCAGW